MRRFYEMNSKLRFSDEVDEWNSEPEEDEDGCCEDHYDDEEDQEREWCD